MLGFKPPPLVEAADRSEEIAVYNGWRRLGYYVAQGTEWLAASDDDQVLGRYMTRQAAIAADARARR
jgi:hypothetical protein